MQNLKSVNTFTADHKYFFLKRNNLTNKQTIETISETEKISAIEHFQKKDDTHS